MEARSRTELFDEGQSSDVWMRSPHQAIFRYSDHIHRDRHIFFGRAMYGAGGDHAGGVTSHFPAEDTRLPCLKKVQLSLDVFNEVPKYRFSESLNTYVDTRKRIRVVSNLDDFDRRASVYSTLPSLPQKNPLGEVLKTTPLMRPCASVPASNNKNHGMIGERPPLRKGNTFFQTSVFQTGSETDRSHMMPCMPLRFRCMGKPLPLWRQKTDTMLINRPNYKLRFRNG